MLESNPERNEFSGAAGNAGIGYPTYLNLARHLAQTDRQTEALMLYLTAYETAAQAADGALDDHHPAVEGLRRAWDLACDLGDRSMAEAVHHRLLPHLTPTEAHECSLRLQDFALSKLKDLGMALDSGLGQAAASGDVVDDVLDKLADLGADAVEASDATPANGTSQGLADDAVEGLTYRDLVGFETAVSAMKARGYGLSQDEGFAEFVSDLNRRHGIDGLPSFDTMLFRSPAREDAARLMFATAGELHQPVIRIRMDSNEQGSSVLCIMASPELRNRFGFAFADTGEQVTLILEDVDRWGLPFEEGEDGDGGTFTHLSRGAQKAIALIRASIENPNITVLASASSDNRIEDYMWDLLSPIEPIDIALPTMAERTRLWTALVREHESLARLDVVKLVQYSANLSRFDIAMATREAIEQAYRDSILKRAYVRVSEDNLYEKLAACQPIDSREYRMLEDALVARFARDLAGLDTYRGEEARD